MPTKKRQQQLKRKNLRKRKNERRQIFASFVESSNVLHDDDVAQPVEITANQEVAEDGEENVDSRPRFTMTAYTGGPMRPGGWHASAPLILDVSGMQTTNGQRIPIHRDHDMGRIVGHTEQITTTKSSIKLAGVVSARNAHADEVVESSRDGFPWQASVGATLQAQPEFIPEGDTTHVNGRRRSGPVYVARKWLLFETSFLSMGADPRTSAVAANFTREVDMNFAQWLKAQGWNEDELSDAQMTTLRAAYDAENASENDDSGDQIAASEQTPAVGSVSEGPSLDDSIQAMREAQANQIERAALIANRLPTAELQAQAVREDWSDDRIELEALRATSASAPAIHSRENGLNVDNAIEAGMYIRARIGSEDQAVREYGEPAVEAAQRAVPRSAGLQWIICQSLRAHGRHVPAGGFSDETIGEAMNLSRSLHANYSQNLNASSGFSTVSLPGILSNLAHKRMLSAFMAVPRVSQQFCSSVPHSNFKVHTKYRFDTAGKLEKLAPTGEITHTTLLEDEYTNQLETYARMLALTRPMMIDDDMGAFLRIPAALGNMTARSLECSVFETFLDNTDGFFAETPPVDASWQQNAISGAGSALSGASLEQAKILFFKQTDQDGHPLMVTPSILLVSPELNQTAINLVNKTTVAVLGDPAAEEQLRVSNEFQGEFNVVQSPYVSHAGIAGNSPTAWWLLSSPTDDFAVCEIAYLNGRQTPWIDSADVEFNQLGMQFRAYFDWGVAKFANRAGVYSAGA